ncbi:BnaA03g60070D [Brassica napus]|uniref:BnaA03g60070D protein n=1 Tax=Brassica napus TaxID=3708 RepID=A0A078GLV6_BRANA|nr:BnaA03g60070D [Brassica napus]
MGAENPRYQNRRATATLTRRAPLQKNSGSTNANQSHHNSYGADPQSPTQIYDPKATSGELPPQPTSLRPTHSTSGPPYHLHTQRSGT